jgi:ribosomal protein S3
MGQKVHPLGLRLGVHRKWKSTWFVSNENYTKFLHLNLKINEFFKGYFNYNFKKSVLIDCKILKYSWEKIYIFLFFYRYRFFIEKRLRKLQRHKKSQLKNILKNKFKTFSFFTNKSIFNLNYLKKYNLEIATKFGKKVSNLESVSTKEIYAIEKQLKTNYIQSFLVNNLYNKKTFIAHNLFLKKYKLYLKNLKLNILKAAFLKQPSQNLYEELVKLNMEITNENESYKNEYLNSYILPYYEKKKAENLLVNFYLQNLNQSLLKLKDINFITLIADFLKNVKSSLYKTYLVLFLQLLKNNTIDLQKSEHIAIFKKYWNAYINLIDVSFIFQKFFKKIYFWIKCYNLIYLFLYKNNLKKNIEAISDVYVKNCIETNKYSTKKTFNSFLRKKKLQEKFTLSKKFFRKNFFKNGLVEKTNIQNKLAKYENKDINFVNKNLYGNLNDVKKALRIITKSKVHLVMINALSFVKFNYRINNNQTLNNNEVTSNDWKLKRKYFAIAKLEEKLNRRYKYTAVLVKDLVNMCFITMFLKKPTALVKFIGYQVQQLPSNRNQIKFLRFIMKTVLSLAGERKEIEGIRIKIQGRFNRWRRTKNLIASWGVIKFQSYNSRIEYGSSKGITKKGTFGVRIWIQYKTSFKEELKNSFMQYFEYSKSLENQNIIQANSFYNTIK